MAITLVLGGQWGDEGKGKLIDVLSVEYVLRVQGGDNAGHTVELDDDPEPYKLHLIPSGILHPKATCVIGNGVVLNPETLVREIVGLQNRGIEVSVDRFKISDRANIIFPYHLALDALKDKGEGIGTTKKGIGPAYAGKASRTNFRMCDVLRGDFAEEAMRRFAEHNELLGFYDAPPITEAAMHAAIAAAQQLGKYVTDTRVLLTEAIIGRKSLLIEGAQAAMLDIDHGTYPYVTSSATTVGGVITGSGLPLQAFRNAEIVGVVKAYTTRVGGGPFPSRMLADLERQIQDAGKEFGTTTGRRRNCGWFDAFQVRYATEVNGFTGLALMKLDILAGLSEVKICTGYRYRGAELSSYPADAKILSAIEPIYRTMPGWDKSNATTFDELPRQAQEYLNTIEQLVGIPIKFISIGPKRGQSIDRGLRG